MLDLALKGKKTAVKITVKTSAAALYIALAVALPYITHTFGGAQAGAVYMPMYLPALLAGITLGWQFGLAVGVLSPLTSFWITSLTGEAMPALSRLPYMTLELAAYGVISGLFAKKAQVQPLYAFAATLCAQAGGRTVYLIYNLIAGKPFAELWQSVTLGFTGLWLQAVIAPAVAILIFAVIKHEQKTK